MNNLATRATTLPAMSDAAIVKVRELETALLAMPQVDPATTHNLHAGMYARTITIPAGCVLTGAHIIIPTMLILSGDATVFDGVEPVRMNGYHVIQGYSGRKQAIHAHADTHLTMIFPTASQSVEACENEFTDEPEMLVSRGERECLA